MADAATRAIGAREAQSLRQVGDVAVDAGRGAGQLDWYRHAADRYVAGKTVLDVGCGLGQGIEILAAAARDAKGQDLDPRLARPGVHIGPLSDLPGKSVDVIVCIEVIEHVEDDAGFVRELGRIARERIFLTTPNWAVTRCAWPYHVREYTPRQLRGRLAGLGRVTMFKGAPQGNEVWPIRNTAFYDLLCDALVWPPTNIPVRVLSKALPRAHRLHAHLAALVDLPTAA